MALRGESLSSTDIVEQGLPVQAIDRAAVLKELENILDSPPFRGTSRSKQFLSYVVRHKLAGSDELLKERNIGADLFHRAADYATGDDPVVRVQAGDVRKRLDKYYHDFPHTTSVRIELPVGSYVPHFRLSPAPAPAPIPFAASVESALPAPAPAPIVGKGSRRKWLPWAGVCLGLAAAVAIVTLGVRHQVDRESILDQFWSPVVSIPQPVLICLSKPVLYRPSLNLYRKYAKTHPGAFATEVEMLNQQLPLDPGEKIPWGDMIPFADFGVGSGDVYAAFRLSALLARMHKATQLRIGNESSFDDFRNSPAVMVGAFSNRWTLEMTSNLRFTFAEKDGTFWIQDRGPKNRAWFWRLGPHREIVEDYGIVTRLLDSETGKVVITVAGISAAGSDAAAQLISGQDYLAECLRTAPSDWQKKNMQAVVQTTVIDSVAGPPHVVATYFW
jgi:hypothetical protein